MQYPYECSACGNRVIRTCRLAEYEAQPSYVCECGEVMTRVITAPRLLANTKPFEAFKSPVDGSIISCERELREHNKRNNVVNIHDGYDEKSLNDFTKRDWQKPLDEERRVDLLDDMRQAVTKLEQGYVPQPATEGEEL